MPDINVKTDEKKQHFDDIYIAENPVPYKERILDALEYISDDFNRQTFDRLILPWVEKKASQSGSVNFVDLCGCFGNTSLATVHGMDYDSIRENWKNSESASNIHKPRRFSAKTTGIDISGPALDYGKAAGIYDETIQVDLNEPDPKMSEQVARTMKEADVVICTAALVYLEPEAIEKILQAYASGSGEGYMLVNFLNPFALDKADATKRLLLKYLDFVGSMASRHRRLSPLEQENYPGEQWALLEVWVLKRKS